MGGPDDTRSSGFGRPKFEIGKHENYEIVDGRRAYDVNSPYPFPNHKPYFAIDAYLVRHRTYRGQVSEVIRREVFERGDSVAVLVYNRDTRKVIVVEQFRLPTVGAGSGWIVEAIAGEVKEGERPEDTAVRETLEESGYKIRESELEPIVSFFSSPGGTSERIHLFFAEVCSDDKQGPGGGTKNEDINPIEYSIDELTKKMRKREFVDPKLVIAAYHLQARLGLRFDTDDAAPNGTSPVAYEWKGFPGIQIGIKTGDVLAVRGVDIWLNPENRYMMMSRMIDKGLSASIRWGGAEKYKDNMVLTDTIGNALRVEMDGRGEAADNEIIETTPGRLSAFGVKRLLHLPIAKARGIYSAREGISVDENAIRPIVRVALIRAHEGEYGAQRFVSWLRGQRSRCTSVLVPLAGSGEGGLPTRHSLPRILDGIGDFLEDCRGRTCLTRFYLLAYWMRELETCQSMLDKHADLRRIS